MTLKVFKKTLVDPSTTVTHVEGSQIYEDGDLRDVLRGGGHCYFFGAVSLPDTPRGSS